MKKIFVSVILALIAVFAFSIPAFASSPTVATVTWNGGGIVGGVVTTGDTTSTFNVSAGLANGSFTATDSNDNPYGYGVDTNFAYIGGSFTNGGTMTFQTVRNTSYAPMYGASGQTTGTLVTSTDSGSMSTDSWTNYAEMTNAMYGHTVVGAADLTANGTYTIQQYVASSMSGNTITGDYAMLTAGGTGTAAINDMTTGASGATNVNLGWGGGCYTNANAIFTGSGTFQVAAAGTNGITTPIADASGAMVAGGWTALGVSSLNTIMVFTSGGSVGNFSVKVN
ncbi:MAG: hypothetical protein ACYDHZ_00940 [Dehalococcoidia bacterium]